MSIDSLYSDNRNRGRRVDQLATQIGDIQAQIKLDWNAGQQQEVYIGRKVDAALKERGLTSVQELYDNAHDALPKEVRESYQQLRSKSEEWNAHMGNTVDFIGYIASVAAGISGTAKGVEFLACGNAAAGIGLAVEALAILPDDAAAAVRLLKLAGTALKSLVGGFEIGEVAAKALKFVKLAGTVLTVVSVVLDGILVIIAAFEGKKQRESLQAAIHDLVHTRLAMETFNIMAVTYRGFISNIYTSCQKIVNHPEDKQGQIKDIDDTTSDLKSELDKMNFEKVWDSLAARDKLAGNSWTNEDPGKSVVEGWWNDEHDPKKFDPKA